MNASHLPLGVAEDHRLGDGKRVVQVAQGVELPLLLLHRHEELIRRSPHRHHRCRYFVAKRIG